VLGEVIAIGKSLAREIRSTPSQARCIVDDIQMKRVLGYIDIGRKDGASVFTRWAAGFERKVADTLSSQTVFDGVRPSMTICARGDLARVVHDHIQDCRRGDRDR